MPRFLCLLLWLGVLGCGDDEIASDFRVVDGACVVPGLGRVVLLEVPELACEDIARDFRLAARLLKTKGLRADFDLKVRIRDLYYLERDERGATTTGVYHPDGNWIELQRLPSALLHELIHAQGFGEDHKGWLEAGYYEIDSHFTACVGMAFIFPAAYCAP